MAAGVIRPLNVMQQGAETFPWVSGWVDAVALAGNAVVNYNVTAARAAMGLRAGQALFVIFAADGPFWANMRDTAAVPVANSTDGSASEFSPNQKYIDENITQISLTSVAAQKVSLQFFTPG